jgi:deoxyadenosine/deoxycytidine kinase/nucleoside 2-deoxyribosyltransferase
LRVYLAGPLFSQAERRFNEELNQLVQGLGFETYFPQVDAGLLDEMVRQGADLQQARDHIFQRNRDAVQRSDIILFVLDGRAPDEGACIEAAVGYALGKEVIGLKTDFRSSEPGGNNLMVDGILQYRLAGDFEQLRDQLERLRADVLGPGPKRRSLAATSVRAHPYVAVVGPIGAGKTSLVRILGSQPGWTTIEEPVDDNPYLNHVYDDLPGLAFRVQAFYLGGRTSQHMRALEIQGPAVQDRCLYEDTEVFATTYHQLGAFDEADLATLRGLYRCLVDLLPCPDLLVYVHAPLSVLQARVRGRGRAFERSLDPTLLERLSASYEGWIDEQSWAPVLAIDSATLDYVKDRAAQQEAVERVHWALQELGCL